MVTALGEGRFRRLRARATAIDEAELRRLSPMVILSPHADDETLGCGGLIATASALGLEIRVAYLTEGGASHVGSPSWPRERLARTRRREALDALTILGVAAGDVLFLDWRDAGPEAQGSALYEASLTELAGFARGAASLWSPWRGEGHGDHVAGAELTADLRERLTPRPESFAFLVWGWKEPALDDADHPRLLECPCTVDVRRRALACHRTQTTRLIDDAANGFLIPPEVAALAERPAEIFLPVS